MRSTLLSKVSRVQFVLELGGPGVLVNLCGQQDPNHEPPNKHQYENYLKECEASHPELLSCI